jgi:transposase
MLQVATNTPIFIVHQPIDFRRGIESLGGFVLEQLQIDLYSGALILFRNKAGNALKAIFYDGTGTWLCLKKLAKGKFKAWPGGEETLSHLKAQELMVLIWNGDPFGSNFQKDWKPVTLQK